MDICFCNLNPVSYLLEGGDSWAFPEMSKVQLMVKQTHVH